MLAMVCMHVTYNVLIELLPQCAHVNSRYTCSGDTEFFDKLDVIQPTLSLTEVVPLSHYVSTILQSLLIQVSYLQWLEWEFHIDPQNDFLLHYER